MTPAVALGIAVALVEYMVFVVLTGRARVRCKIAAPATTGHPEFERYFRVQQNTVEQLVLFVPALLVFGQYVSGGWLALLLALTFAGGRWLYFAGYVSNPERRGLGFGIGAIATGILVVSGAIGAILALARGS